MNDDSLISRSYFDIIKTNGSRLLSTDKKRLFRSKIIRERENTAIEYVGIDLAAILNAADKNTFE